MCLSRELSNEGSSIQLIVLTCELYFIGNVNSYVCITLNYCTTLKYCATLNYDKTYYNKTTEDN